MIIEHKFPLPVLKQEWEFNSNNRYHKPFNGTKITVLAIDKGLGIVYFRYGSIDEDWGEKTKMDWSMFLRLYTVVNRVIK